MSSASDDEVALLEQDVLDCCRSIMLLLTRTGLEAMGGETGDGGASPCDEDMRCAEEADAEMVDAAAETVLCWFQQGTWSAGSDRR